MSRYRKAKAVPVDPNAEKIVIDTSGTKKKVINYIWMPDKNGNLVKEDSARVKKRFASLSKDAQRALADYVTTVQNRQPTDAARKTAFNSIIDAATEAFKQGKKATPWDILNRQIKNTPLAAGPTITYTNFDRLSADALLSKAARALGFKVAFSDADFNDFLTKIQEAAKAGGKQRQQITRPDGTVEVIETPGLFDANQFTQNYLWTKVNVADPKTIPTSVINQVDALKALANANGLGYLSSKELANFALQLAKGDIELGDLQRQFNTKAAELYPMFSERLKANPSLTVRDLAEPYINQMAKRWEIDPSQINLDNKDLDKFIRPDGTAGKVPMGSLAEWDQYLITHPNADKTTWAIKDAGQLGAAFARMSGYGV